MYIWKVGTLGGSIRVSKKIKKKNKKKKNISIRIFKSPSIPIFRVRVLSTNSYNYPNNKLKN